MISISLADTCCVFFEGLGTKNTAVNKTSSLFSGNSRSRVVRMARPFNKHVKKCKIANAIRPEFRGCEDWRVALENAFC